MTFEEFGLSENVMRGLDAMNFKEATPVQEQTIPVILQKRDLIACAQTGTGKTAAYILPLLNLLTEKQGDGDRVRAVIVAPTRELAQQIDMQFEGFSYFLPISTVVVSGGGDGASWDQQKRGLTMGADIIIATPGRLISHLNISNIDFSGVECFILDEADRMLDMGFVADIKRLLPLLPKSRQTLFFSATMPADIVALSKSMLTDPVRVEVTPVASAVDAIDQRVYFVEKPEKKKLLVSLLREEDKSVLVFSRTKHGADNISRLLSKSGIRSEAIHGNKSQNHRQRVLTDFKSGKIRVMVATDIAARGIDIRELEIVINYDLPDVPETYVHRIGRTGRAGHSGTALTFCTPDERPLMKDIQRLTGKKLNAETYRA